MTDMSLVSKPMLLMSGSANRPLAEEIAQQLDTELCRVTLRRFADGEIFVKIDDNVRGRDVYIIQSTNPPAENLLELLLLMDAARRASAARITAVIPYFGYARQDRKDQPRVAISAKLMANMVSVAGADRVLAIDFHQHQLQGFFDLPVDHLYAAPVFVNHYKQKKLEDVVVVAPDVGSAKMARGFAKRLNGSLAIIDKRRTGANMAEALNVVRGCREELHHSRRHDRYRWHDGRGRACAQATGRPRHLHLRNTRPAVGAGRGTAIDSTGDRNRGHQHDCPAARAAFSDAQGALHRGLLAKAIRYTHSDQSVSALFD
jgi:ribose-phosphate pyrophosphokinase